jgi:hypothetical protein
LRTLASHYFVNNIASSSLSSIYSIADFMPEVMNLLIASSRVLIKNVKNSLLFYKIHSFYTSESYGSLKFTFFGTVPLIKVMTLSV